MWGEGYFKLSAQSTGSSNLKSCSSFDGGRFHNGIWNSSCNFEQLSPRQLRYVLIGKKFAIYGDSLARQVFLRLVAHARGFHSIVEVYFQTNAFYVFNETHDYLGVSNTSHSIGIEVIQSPLFTMNFFWSP